MRLSWLPNALTLARCGLAFVVAGLTLEAPDTSFLPLVAFVAVALTDFLDGWAARWLKAVSELGAFLDPIADKLLVGLSLLALSFLQHWAILILVPTVIIILRDLIATGLRLIPSVEMPVSKIAKWKTAIEMIGIGALLAAPAFASTQIWNAGLVLIWLAALLSVYTLGLYLGALIAETKRPHQ
ncbi:MAG: CDP-alcohol phosphatidyltransferase family protein [Pseudomonadota bacterium]